jgi:hypothetical protein
MMSHWDLPWNGAGFGSVTLIFAGTGDMLGAAKISGSAWTKSEVSLFLVKAVLTCVRWKVTGMQGRRRFH